MFKHYLRTLKKSIKYAAIILGIYFLGSFLLVTVANFFKDTPFVSTLILLGTPTLIAFGVSIKVRKNDHDLSKIYRNASETFHLRVGHDLKKMLCSKSFLMEIAVFCTYLVILCIIGGRIIFSTPLFTAFLLIGCVALFVILNAVSWLIVHKAYLKDKII